MLNPGDVTMEPRDSHSTLFSLAINVRELILANTLSAENRKHKQQ